MQLEKNLNLLVNIVHIAQEVEKISLNMIDEFRQGEALQVQHGQQRPLLQIRKSLHIASSAKCKHHLYILRQARSVKIFVCQSHEELMILYTDLREIPNRPAISVFLNPLASNYFTIYFLACLLSIDQNEVIDKLNNGPVKIADLNKALPDLNLGSLLQSLTLLAHGDAVGFYVQNANKKPAIIFNLTLAELVSRGAQYRSK